MIQIIGKDNKGQVIYQRLIHILGKGVIQQEVQVVKVTAQLN